ncbi:hypothetical protein PHMEG_00024744 [Phytophthora megakarya]|uniref:Uncharacterized protein n=1 Tax=Phytophthora megakarya TaxID=4795 RepID=A0A225VEG6_9STRA|nr:hypothetical protein PHMEG_00024744 [Phytophthora megakarya]
MDFREPEQSMGYNLVRRKSACTNGRCAARHGTHRSSAESATAVYSRLINFWCATGWMRDSIIDYARKAQPLQRCLDEVLASKERTKRVTTGITIELTDAER